MKKLIGLIVFGGAFLIFVLLYLHYDNKGYYNGLGCTFCNKPMPYHLSPNFYSGYPQSFTLKDEDDFELVGIGFRYRKSSFSIKNFLAYGYNDTSLVVKCTDSLNKIKYLISYETGYKSEKGNPEISFKDLSNSHFEQIKNNYKWIDIDEEKANTIQFMKFLFIFGAVLSLIFIVWRLFKLRRNKAT